MTTEEKSVFSITSLKSFHIKHTDCFFPWLLTEISSLSYCQELLKSQSYQATTLPASALQPEALRGEKQSNHPSHPSLDITNHHLFSQLGLSWHSALKLQHPSVPSPCSTRMLWKPDLITDEKQMLLKLRGAMNTRTAGWDPTAWVAQVRFDDLTVPLTLKMINYIN